MKINDCYFTSIEMWRKSDHMAHSHCMHNIHLIGGYELSVITLEKIYTFYVIRKKNFLHLSKEELISIENTAIISSF